MLQLVARVLEREGIVCVAVYAPRRFTWFRIIMETMIVRSPMNRVDHDVVDTIVGSPPTSTTRSRRATQCHLGLVSRGNERPRAVDGGSARQEPERARTGKGHEAVDGCVFRRNMGLFPFATRFARASQLAFVASLSANDLNPRLTNPQPRVHIPSAHFFPYCRRSERQFSRGCRAQYEIISKFARNSPCCAPRV